MWARLLKMDCLTNYRPPAIASLDVFFRVFWHCDHQCMIIKALAEWSWFVALAGDKTMAKQ